MAGEAEKARFDLWQALNNALPCDLNPNAITELRDAIDALIVARSAQPQPDNDNAERVKRRNAALSELGWAAPAVSEIWDSPDKQEAKHE
jgi:hypothetical protein